MAVSVTYASTVTVAETLPGAIPSALAAKKIVTHDVFNTSLTLNAASTPPASTMAAFTQALSGNTATIDLTTLVGTNGSVVNGTGLKVQLLKAKATATNANPITISVGAANGYDLSGAAFSVTLSAGQEVTLYGNDASPDIAAGDKEIDLLGTGAQTIDIMIVMG